MLLFTSKLACKARTNGPAVFYRTDLYLISIDTAYPNLDYIFLNAGMQRTIDFTQPQDINLDFLEYQMNLNFSSIAILCIKFLCVLLKKDYATGIVFSGSHSGIIPMAPVAVYAASKAALRSFVDSLRFQLRDQKVKIIDIVIPLTRSREIDV